MEPNPPPPTVKPAALPLVALILAVVFLCIPPLLFIPFIMGIVSLVKAGGSPAYAARKTLAIVALVLPVVMVAPLGILAAIAIPNFIKFQVRSKQAECKVQLTSYALEAERYRLEHDAYPNRASQLSPTGGFTPTRYVFLFDAEGPLVAPGQAATADAVGLAPRLRGDDAPGWRAAMPEAVVRSLGVHGECPDCGYTYACVSNLDNDEALDVWSVSSEDRTGADGELVPAGTVYQHSDDAR